MTQKCTVCNSDEIETRDHLHICKKCNSIHVNNCEKNPTHINPCYSRFCIKCGSKLKSFNDIVVNENVLSDFNGSNYNTVLLNKKFDFPGFSLTCGDEGLFIDKNGLYLIFKNVYSDEILHFSNQLNIQGNLTFIEVIGTQIIFKADNDVFTIKWTELWTEIKELKPSYTHVNFIKKINQKVYVLQKDELFSISEDKTVSQRVNSNSFVDIFESKDNLYLVEAKNEYLSINIKKVPNIDNEIKIPISRESLLKIIAIDDIVLVFTKSSSFCWFKIRYDQLNLSVKKLELSDSTLKIDAFKMKNKIHLFTESSIYYIDLVRFKHIDVIKEHFFTNANVLFDHFNKHYVCSVYDMATQKYNIVLLNEQMEQILKSGNISSQFLLNIVNNHSFVLYNENENSVFLYPKIHGDLS